MEGIFAFISLLFSCYFLLRIIQPIGISEYWLFFFTLFVTHVVVIGYLLSYFSLISQIKWWAIFGTVMGIISVSLFSFAKKSDQAYFPRLNLSSFSKEFRLIKEWYFFRITRLERWLLTPMFITVLILGILNLSVIIFTAPHNWDSMAVHLARMSYYLQNNNLSYFDANHWAQVTHPKIQSILLIYTYLVSERNENFTQFVQFISYWIAINSIFAISLRAGNSKVQSIFAALSAGLLINWLMESTTTQNDMILTAFLGVITYSLISFKNTNRFIYLIFAAIGIGLAIGTKEASIIPLISMGVITFFSLASASIRTLIQNFWCFTLLVTISLSILTLPSGYLEVYRNFRGHMSRVFRLSMNHSVILL